MLIDIYTWKPKWTRNSSKIIHQELADLAINEYLYYDTMLSAYVRYTVHLTEINVDVTNDSRLSWAAYHALIQNPSTLLISGDMISHSKTMPVHWP